MFTKNLVVVLLYLVSQSNAFYLFKGRSSDDPHAVPLFFRDRSRFAVNRHPEEVSIESRIDEDGYNLLDEETKETDDLTTTQLPEPVDEPETRFVQVPLITLEDYTRNLTGLNENELDTIAEVTTSLSTTLDGDVESRQATLFPPYLILNETDSLESASVSSVETVESEYSDSGDEDSESNPESDSDEYGDYRKTKKRKSSKKRTTTAPWTLQTLIDSTTARFATDFIVETSTSWEVLESTTTTFEWAANDHTTNLPAPAENTDETTDPSTTLEYDNPLETTTTIPSSYQSIANDLDTLSVLREQNEVSENTDSVRSSKSFTELARDFFSSLWIF